MALEGAAALRQRARLLEFLKFRVLASQETFFEAWRLDEPAVGESLPHEPPRPGGPPHTPANGPPPWNLAAFRAWLLPLWPAAACLSDDDLGLCLEQARHLYLDPPPHRR